MSVKKCLLVGASKRFNLFFVFLNFFCFFFFFCKIKSLFYAQGKKVIKMLYEKKRYMSWGDKVLYFKLQSVEF